MHYLFQFLQWLFTTCQPLVIIPSVLFVAWLILAWRRGAPYDRCAKCGYDAVQGLTQPVCPECGADLSKRGVRQGGNPNYIVWASRLTVWALVWLAIASVFSGPWVHVVPQPYRVQWVFLNPPYLEDETGHSVRLTVSALAFRWPWQSTVYAAAERVNIAILRETPGTPQYRFGGNIWWTTMDKRFNHERPDRLRKWLPLPMPDTYFAGCLQTPLAEAPIWTARHLLALIDQQRLLIGPASRRFPHLSGGGIPVAFALPEYPKRITFIVRWLCLVLWLIGGAVMDRRWRRSGLVDWQP